MTFFLFLMVCCVATFCGCSGDVGKRDKAELGRSGVERALEHAKSGEYSRAIELLEKSLEADPGLARIHLELGVLLHETEKDYIGAIYHYRKYLLLRPGSEKKGLIEDRMRIARQLLAAGVVGIDNVSAVRIKELEKANLQLKSRISKADGDLAELRRNTRSLKGSSQASNSLAGAGTGPALTQEGGLRHYTVQSRDSLSTIAVKVYKDANKWDQIYEANRKVLENSNELKVGQVLIIP